MDRRKIASLLFILATGTVYLFGQGTPITGTGRNLPSRVGGATLTSSGVLSGSSTIGPVTVFTPSVGGLYRISANTFTTTVGAGGTWQVCMTTNNGTASIVSCGASSNFTGTVGSTESNVNSLPKWVAASQAITFQINVTTASGSPVLGYSYSVERLN